MCPKKQQYFANLSDLKQVKTIVQSFIVKTVTNQCQKPQIVMDPLIDVNQIRSVCTFKEVISLSVSHI